MQAWISSLVNFFTSVWNDVLFQMDISSGNTVASLGGILLVFIIIGFVVNVFWKGAKQ